MKRRTISYDNALLFVVAAVIPQWIIDLWDSEQHILRPEPSNLSGENNECIYVFISNVLQCEQTAAQHKISPLAAVFLLYGSGQVRGSAV